MGIRLQLALAAGLLGALVSAASEIKDRDCLECHEDKSSTSTNSVGVAHSIYADASILRASAHGKVHCAECHSDLTAKHPDDNLPAKAVVCARCHEKQASTYGASVHAEARIHHARAGKKDAPDCVDCHGTHEILAASLPASPLHFLNLAKTCGRCHEQESRDVIESMHGKALAAGRRDAPTCTDCHSEHKIVGLKNSSSLAVSRDTCGKCHASERLNTKYNLPGDRVKTFFASYHGLAAQYGSTRAANCASCHGVHRILASTDPRSSIYPTNLATTCGQCHPGADARFARGKIHLDAEAAVAGSNLGEQINWWVRKIYLGLIVGVIGLMAAHNALVFGRKAAARARRAGRTVLRMDFSQRAQHFVLAFSFILLAVTGFALKFPDSWIAHLLGSDENFRRWAHRLSGVALLLAGAYHVGYAAATRQGRSLVRDMFPTLQDARDVAANARYLTGVSLEKPKFGRFGYAEKMEYWAVAWGTILMGATGLLIWFKLWATHWLPRWSIDVATTIHYYEAILACLAIVVWHFYHVIFDPDVYPLNRACIDGQVSPEWYEEEHPLDAAHAAHLTNQPRGTIYIAMKAKNKRTPVVSQTNCQSNDRAAWIKGGQASCAVPPVPPKGPCRLVLLGAPGVGKGTQADLLHSWSGACHLSTGDIFRAAKELPAAELTASLRSALALMARGELVPDQTVLEVLRERAQCLSCSGGFLLDGFPRTTAQAEALDQLLKAEGVDLTAVIDYDWPLEKIIARLAGRRVCANCKGVFHVTAGEPLPEACVRCGGQLLQREDDKPEAVRVRMEAYHRSTEPLIQFYRDRDLLVTISAEGTPDEVFRRTEEALSGRPHVSG